MLFTSRIRRDRTTGRGARWPRREQLEDRTLPSTLVALTSNDHLLTFDSSAPGTIVKNTAVTGLAAGDELHSIALSPQGTLYGIAANPPGMIASFNRLYTLNAATGAATPGADLTSGLFSENGTVAASFDPVSAQLRLIDQFGGNRRIDPATGAVTNSGQVPAYAAGDIHQGFVCSLSSMAYTDQVAGATSTTLYGIATVPSPTLVIIGGRSGQPSPDTGEARTVAASQATDALTITGAANAAFAVSKNPNTRTNASLLWKIDLSSGTETLVGGIHSASPVIAMAAAPSGGGGPGGGGTILGGIYTEDLLHPFTTMPAGDYVDHSGVFANAFQGSASFDPYGTHDGGVSAVVLFSGSTARITFPNLDSHVGVLFACIDLRALGEEANVVIVGANGTYTSDVTAGLAAQTVSVGEQYVLEGDAFNPVLELGPIREIDVTAGGAARAGAAIELVRVLVGENPPPDVGPEKFFNTGPGQPGTIDVLAGASEAGGAPLHLAPGGFTQPALGSVAVDPDHADQLVYTPGPGVHFLDTFFYTIEDPLGQAATGKVTVTVNRAPVATDDRIVLRVVDGGVFPGARVDGQVKASDPDGDPLTVTLLQGPAHNMDRAGPFQLNSDGTFTYYLGGYVDPSTSGFVEDQFTFQVSDGFDVSSVATEQIAVNDGALEVADHLPVLNYPFDFDENHFFSRLYFKEPPGTSPESLDKNTVHGINTDQYLVITQGTDLHSFDTDTRLVVATPPLRGTVHLYDDGTFQYVPLVGFTGTDSFDLPVTDGFQDAFINNTNYEVRVTIRVYPKGLIDTFGETQQTEDDFPPPATNSFNVASATTPELGGDPTLVGRPITLTAPPGADLTQVQAVANPSPAGEYPDGLDASAFSVGFLEFQVKGLTDPPPMPTDRLAITAGGVNGGFVRATYFVRYTYVTDTGNESLAGGGTTVAVQQDGEQLTITAPPAAPHVAGWRVYIAGGPNLPYILQVPTLPAPSTLLPFGTSVTLGALTTTGATAPLGVALAPPDYSDNSGRQLFAIGSRGSTLPHQFQLQVAYTVLGGQTNPGPAFDSPSLTPGETLTILHPPSAPGATGWRVYASVDGGPYTLQGTTRPLDADITLTSLTTHGPTPPWPTGGASTTVVIGLPQGVPDPVTYYKYGPTPDDVQDHWYPFLFDGRTGAVLPGQYDPLLNGGTGVPSGEIVLHFVDGQRGDDDVANLADYGLNGTLVDAGGPSAVLPGLTGRVQGAVLQPDPLAAGKTMLVVVGTSAADVIRLIPTDDAGDIEVLVDGQLQGVFHPTGHIAVYGNGGNDSIRLGSPSPAPGRYRIRVPAFLFAADGNTILDAGGSSADNVLVAGAGVSRLIGGPGRDILIASPQSTFQNRGNDLIIKGITPLGDDVATLSALSAEWSRTGTTDAARIDHLLHGGGANGAVVLSGAVTVRSAHNTLLATPLVAARPTLIGPQGALAVTAIMPTFAWNPVAGAERYQVHVDDLTSGHRDVLVSPAVVGTRWVAPAPLIQGHSYRWWVQGEDSLGNVSLGSSTLRFGIGALGRPTPVWPLGRNAGATPTLLWSAVPGADHYQLMLENVTTSRPVQVAGSSNVAPTNWMPPFALSAGAKYRWRVRAVGPGGSVGAWSDPAAFTV